MNEHSGKHNNSNSYITIINCTQKTYIRLVELRNIKTITKCQCITHNNSSLHLVVLTKQTKVNCVRGQDRSDMSEGHNRLK